MRLPLCISWCAAIFAVVAAAPAAETPSADEQAIRKNLQAYISAYQRRDAKALAAMWAPKAIYVNPETGRRSQGREAIEKEFASQFKKSGPSKLRVNVQSIRLITSDVAIEDGTATVIDAAGETSKSTYTAVHVKQSGAWLLESVRETETPAPSSNYEKLKELEWMIGRWVDEDDETTVETTCDWVANKSFITRSFKITVNGEVDLQGTQIIGWDAKNKRIRSWVFDSDGGFSEGTWRRDGDRWIISQTGQLIDGRSASATNVLKYVDDDTCTWQSIGRTVDSGILPNVEEVTVVRVKPSDE